MCGRFTLIRLADFTELFSWILPAAQNPPPRYNIAPTQPVATVTNQAQPKLEFLHWGLIPSWAKDPAIGSRLINARAETLAEKPAFKTALRRRRCLIPASGFYEWRKEPGKKGKTPMYITQASGRPLAFAGLWDIWHEPGGGEIPSCTIITTTPNELMKSIHDRMPAVLKEQDYKTWLAPDEQPAEKMLEMLAPYPAKLMVAHPVSPLVNSPKNDVPECIQSPADGPTQGSLFAG